MLCLVIISLPIADGTVPFMSSGKQKIIGNKVDALLEKVRVCFWNTRMDFKVVGAGADIVQWTTRTTSPKSSRTIVFSTTLVLF